VSQIDDKDALEQSRPAKRSDITPESASSAVETHRRLEDLTSTLLAIMERLRWQDKELSARVQRYQFPFVVDDDFIRKLNRRATEWLERAGILSDHPISVNAEVSFADQTTLRFAMLDECLDKAGDHQDPVGMTIEWSAVLREPLSSTAKIHAVFTTEKPPQVTELRWFEVPVASMKLEIAGPDRQWVNNTFSELDPLFNNAQPWSWYRPLHIFRNRNVVSIASWATGFYTQMLYLGLVEWLKRPQVNIRRQEPLERILNQPTLETKLDQFVREVFGPVSNSPIFDGLWVIMSSFVVVVIITLIGYKIFPMLVPRAGINIGLAATRYSSYQEVYRFVIVGILLLAIIFPLIRSWIFASVF
jgi:hypothetical protein